MTEKRKPISLRGRAVNKPEETEEATPKVTSTKKKSVTKKKTAPKKKVVQKKPETTDKVIRDSFTMPDHDYALIDEIKTACIKQGIVMNKAEILRAGLRALASMSDPQLKKAAGTIEKIKTGRPKG
jgi:hypothetical protein